MGVVLLVRHGQASFGADDYDVLSRDRLGAVAGCSARCARRARRSARRGAARRHAPAPGDRRGRGSRARAGR